jgi:hypothetical protein
VVQKQGSARGHRLLAAGVRLERQLHEEAEVGAVGRGARKRWLARLGSSALGLVHLFMALSAKILPRL